MRTLPSFAMLEHRLRRTSRGMGSLAAPFGPSPSVRLGDPSFAPCGGHGGLERFWLGLLLAEACSRGTRTVRGLRSLSPEDRREACRVKDQVRATDASSAAETCEMITKPPRRCQIPRGRLKANMVMPSKSIKPEDGSGTAPKPTIMD